MKKLLFKMLVLLPIAASAQVVQVKGVGSTSYDTSLFAKGPSAEIKDKALRAAEVSAVERYFAESGESESQNFEAIQDKVEANLEKFILGTTILSEQDRPDLKKYSVSIRAELNVAKLRNALRGSSSVNNVASAAKSPIVYLFMGREVSNVRSYDAREVKRIEISEKAQGIKNTNTRGSEGESISDTSISTNASKKTTQNISMNVSAKVESGGSVTRKSDDVSYRLLPMSNTKTSITSAFSQGGYNVVEPEFILADKDFKSVSKDFSSGNDLAPSTMRAVVMSMKKNQIPYLAMATLDVGAPMQDPASGMQRIAVIVTGRVLDVSGPFPREVASVPEVQLFGVGPDNASAMNKGLKDAALAAAREVVSRLNAAGIH